MNTQVIEALKSVHYKVCTEKYDLDRVYRLRYACYRAEGSIPQDDREIMTDPFDETENCVHVAIEQSGTFVAAVRLHLVSDASQPSPTIEVFPELLERVCSGRTVLDPTRFVIDPTARKNRVPLHFLALRIPFLAAMFYDIDLALAPVRKEHTAFYQRYLGYKQEIPARSYPGLAKPVHLLTSDFRENRDEVLARTPVFGPLQDFPEANIPFPELSGIYKSSRQRRFRVA